jgi:hypothetical protein
MIPVPHVAARSRADYEITARLYDLRGRSSPRHG